MRNYEDTYTIPKGTVVMLSHGSYSDYRWDCLACALWDVDVQAVRAEWEAARRAQPERWACIVAWLTRPDGYFEERPRPLEWNVEYMRVTVPPED